jgi:hypothetical protein
MQSFRDFVAREEAQPAPPAVHANVWHAGKEQVIDMWKNLRPSPIMMRPVPEGHRGTRLHQDGIRLTGSPQFINSVLSRIKEVLAYENQPGMRLDLEYREIESKTPTEEATYLCYIHLEQDLKKKMKTPSAAHAPELSSPFEKPPAVKVKTLKTAMPET